MKEEGSKTAVQSKEWPIQRERPNGRSRCIFACTKNILLL